MMVNIVHPILRPTFNYFVQMIFDFFYNTVQIFFFQYVFKDLTEIFNNDFFDLPVFWGKKMF